MTWSTLVKGQQRRHPLSFLRDGSTGVSDTHTRTYCVHAEVEKKERVDNSASTFALLMPEMSPVFNPPNKSYNHVGLSIQLKKEKISFMKFWPEYSATSRCESRPEKRGGYYN
jgi:hypothetical protein